MDRSDLEITEKKNSDHIEESIIILQEALTPCGTKFLRVLILAILPAIRKNKNYRKHFSRKNLLQSKYSVA